MNEIQEYLSMLELGGKSIHTIRLYNKDLKKLLSFCKSKSITFKDMTTLDFQEFYKTQILSVESMNGLIRSLSAFFSWMKDTYRFESEFFNVRFGRSKYLKKSKVKKMILSDDEATKLIESGANFQERFMLALMLYTAIRRDEVASIQMTDIQGCRITINGKGSKQRNVFLDDVLCHMLNVYMTERKTTSNYLFYATRGEKSSSGKLSGGTINNRVKSAGKRANIPDEKLSKLSAHRLRGTGLTRLIILFGIDTAQRIAGHSNTNTTRIYDESGDALVRRALLSQRQVMTSLGE